jgi:hypothetical protein
MSLPEALARLAKAELDVFQRQAFLEMLGS